MSYSIGQTFTDKYPPQVAIWCNKNNAFIKKNGNTYTITAIPQPTESELAEQALAQRKAERADAVSRITVVVDGMTFDGDETSQDRMARAITMANVAGLETTNWVLADNTIAEVTVAQLAQALVLAGQKQTELWVKPYAGADVGEVDE